MLKLNKPIIITTVILIGAAVFAAWQTISTAQTGSKAVTLSFTTDRSEYSLGDVIGLRFEISNQTDSSVELRMPDVRFGTLKVYVSADGANFREYVGPHWASQSSAGKTTRIASGEEFQSEATMLHNRTAAAGHLTEAYAERIRKENLDTHFSMLTAGRYWLKARYSDGKTRLESDPLAIDITQPVGLDAVVWETIKTDEAYAYFLQTGDVRSIPGSPRTAEFVESLQRITAQFPESRFAGKITVGLSKRNAMLENLRRFDPSR